MLFSSALQPLVRSPVKGHTSELDAVAECSRSAWNKECQRSTKRANWGHGRPTRYMPSYGRVLSSRCSIYPRYTKPSGPYLLGREHRLPSENEKNMRTRGATLPSCCCRTKEISSGETSEKHDVRNGRCRGPSISVKGFGGPWDLLGARIQSYRS